MAARVQQVRETKAPVPEGRRYFLKVLERIEFEVTTEEYQRVATRMLDIPPESTPPALSFNLGIIDGWYVDPAKEAVLPLAAQETGDPSLPPKTEVEVIDSGNRT